MTVTAQHVPILKDNYAWLLTDSATGARAIVDPAEAGPIIAAIDASGGRLDMILLTHHHGDHIADTDVIRARYKCPVVGAAADAHRLPKLDQAVKDGDTVTLGSAKARVIETPGHTVGQVNYFFPDGPVLLSGDTLFSLGCGRLIEGNAQMMFDSLAKLKSLPADTLVCCGHEYTESNARFALHVDPNNTALKAMSDAASALRAQGKPTVPSRMGDEVKANPFLTATTVAAFAERRAGKDKF
ncbi:MAG: hydroxyacylglutathione hydrolase [Acetobacteraceae bacterium]